jgi:hypothetical protein
VSQPAYALKSRRRVYLDAHRADLGPEQRIFDNVRSIVFAKQPLDQ